MPSHAATAKAIMACKRLPPYVRRPVRSQNIAVIDIGRFRAYRNRASRPRGGVVTQRTANPRTPVQFRAWPPISGICYRFATPIVPAEHKTCAERSRKQPRVAVTRNRILIGFVMVLVLACAVAVMAVMAVARFSGLF